MVRQLRKAKTRMMRRKKTSRSSWSPARRVAGDGRGEGTGGEGQGVGTVCSVLVHTRLYSKDWIDY